LSSSFSFRKVIYNFGRIAPSTTGVIFSRPLEPQPCKLREVHIYGGASTNFDVEIYDDDPNDKLNLVYSNKAINIESHEIVSPFAVLYNSERRTIYFKVNNNDSTHNLELRVKLVYEE